VPFDDDEPPAPDGAPAPAAQSPRAEQIERTFKKCLERGRPIAEKYRAIARVNEAFFGGDHWSVLTAKDGKVSIDSSAWFDKEGVPRIHVNLFTGHVMTWSALLSASRPTVEAIASTSEPADTFRAQFAQQVIEEDAAGKVHEALQLAALGGTAGLKIVWLAGEQRISWAPISVHDFILDPKASDWSEAGWVIFEDHLDTDEAKELFEENGITDKEPAEKDYKNAAGDVLYGVERHEFWLRPTREYPEGLYACFVDGELVEEMAYPVVEQDDSGKDRFPLPMSLVRVRLVRGSAYGMTNFTEAVPLQRAYNEAVARTQKLIRTTTNVHLKLPEELGPIDLTSTNEIRFKQAMFQAADAIEWTQPPQIPQAVFSQRDFFGTMMELVVGLNAVTAGRQGSASMSGRLAEHLVELDQNRNADCTRSLQKMVLEAYRLSLVLIRRYYDEQRQMRITNGDSVDVAMFSGADLQGVDVRLAPGSEMDTLPGVREQKEAERIASGVAGPNDLARAQKQPGFGGSQRTAEMLLDAFLQTGQLDELPGDLDFGALDETIAKRKAHALARNDMDLWVSVDMFAKQVAQLKGRADDLVSPMTGGEEIPPDSGAMT
jgi:hypothetical protein